MSFKAQERSIITEGNKNFLDQDQNYNSTVEVISNNSTRDKQHTNHDKQKPE